MLDWLEGPAVLATLRRVKELGQPVVGLKMRNADCSGEDLSGLMLVEAELIDIRFSRVNLTGALFSQCTFNGVVLDEAQLAQVKIFKSTLSLCTAIGASGRRLSILQSELKHFDASNAKFIEARFVETKFEAVKLNGSDLNTTAMVMTTHDKTDFSNALLEQTSFFNLDLRSCLFKEVRGARIVLTSSNLSGVDLRGVFMPQAQCGGTSFAQARVDGANFSRANFIDANLSGCQMRQCDLSFAAFLRVNLSNAILDHAILDRARFVRSKLTDASLQNVKASRSVWHVSDMENVSLKNAVLTEAEMIGSNLTRADLRGASMRAAKLDRTEQTELQIDSTSRAALGQANDSYSDFVMANT